MTLAATLEKYDVRSLRPVRAGISRNVLSLATLLILLQILDAILTSIGLDISGSVHGEGNILLRYGMSLFGVVPTLVIAKTCSVMFISALVTLSIQVRWIEGALAGLVGLYFSAAIVPWTLIILNSL